MANLRTPLYDWHVQRKARMVPFGGWDMPVQYSGIIDEHRAVRHAAGLFDISHMARLSFSGKDVLPLIESVYTNSAASMKEGQVRYGLVCNEEGGILDDILVYRWSYGWAMVVNASNREKIVGWLKTHSSQLDAVIDDRTLTTAMLAVQGPQAVEISAGLFADDVRSLKYYYSQPTRYRDQGCVVSRTGYTGEDGLEIIVPKDLAVPLADDLVARGAVPCGLGCRDTLRLEAAMPLYGHELSESIDPFQAGLAWAVKLDKGPFLGQSALKRRKNDASLPRRVGLELEGKRAAREGCPVLQAGRTVGTVCSGSYAPGLEKSIAMAYVTPELSAIGTSVEIDIRGTMTPARVVAMPFYKRSN